MKPSWSDRTWNHRNDRNHNLKHTTQPRVKERGIYYPGEQVRLIDQERQTDLRVFPALVD